MEYKPRPRQVALIPEKVISAAWLIRVTCVFHLSRSGRDIRFDARIFGALAENANAGETREADDALSISFLPGELDPAKLAKFEGDVLAMVQDFSASYLEWFDRVSKQARNLWHTIKARLYPDYADYIAPYRYPEGRKDAQAELDALPDRARSWLNEVRRAADEGLRIVGEVLPKGTVLWHAHACNPRYEVREVCCGDLCLESDYPNGYRITNHLVHDSQDSLRSHGFTLSTEKYADEVGAVYFRARHGGARTYLDRDAAVAYLMRELEELGLALEFCRQQVQLPEGGAGWLHHYTHPKVVSDK